MKPSNFSRCSALLMYLVFAFAPTANAHEVHDHDHATGEFAAASSFHDHLARFRATGDDEILDLAAALLPQDLDDPTVDNRQLVDAARLAQSQHRFDAALTLLDRAIELSPRDDEAWLLRASVHLVRGNGTAAAQACNQLRQLPLLTIITCQARAALSQGDGRVAKRLQALVEATDPESIDEELLSWSYSTLGDALFADDTASAVTWYRRSLQLTENTQTRAALVDALLDQGDLDDAMTVVDRSVALPLAIRRLIVARRLGRDGISADVRHMDHRFRHWIAAGDLLHAREMARFYLDVLPRPELARRLAEANLSLQREREDLALARRTGATSS